MNCLTCNNYTTNPKFCTRSCAATYNNSKFPKREGTKSKKVLCTNCHENYKKASSTYCAPCRTLVEDERIAAMTLEQSLNLDGSRASKYNTVRHHARKIALKYSKVCVVCNYDKIVNVCHIKAIKDFTLNTLVSEVNSLDNLTVLCPNHHWELDHNLLEEDYVPLSQQ